MGNGYEALQTSKEQNKRRQDLCWKIHDRAKSFCLSLMRICMITWLLLRNRNVSIGQFLSQYKTTIVFCARSRQKKREQKHATKNVVEFHSHFPPATMISRQTVNLKTRLICLENVQRWSKHLTLTELRTGMYPRLLPCEYWHSRRPVTSLFLFPSIRSCYKCKFVVRVD